MNRNNDSAYDLIQTISRKELEIIRLNIENEELKKSKQDLEKRMMDIQGFILDFLLNRAIEEDRTN